MTVVYDTGALIAADRRDLRLLNLHRAFLAQGVRPIVPVVVLAQAWRGAPHPTMSRLLKGCLVQPDNEWTGRTAGALCAATGTSDVVDALVVVTAAIRKATIVTSDPVDLRRLADGLDLKIEMLVV